ncbi:MAG: acyltransferase family protein [Verrucomicrobiota bacterium]
MSHAPAVSYYRPEIDGLRGVAILAVLLFHADLSFPGGFAGVDVFFVISGFLIAGILAREISSNTFSLKNFWERRIKRLFPAAFAVVITVLLTGYFLLLPSDWRELLDSAIANAVFGSNVFFWRNIDYFSSSAELKPLLHTWSLAVEEQFYLILPTFLAVLSRFLGPPSIRKVLGWSSLVIIIGSFALCCLVNNSYQPAAFYLLPTRAWELAVGCFIALYPQIMPESRKVREVLSMAGCAMIFLSFFLLDSKTMFPGAATLLPVTGTALIISATAGGKTWTGTFLKSKPLLACGLISYSLYLWHWPILAYMRYLSPGRLSMAQILLCLAFTFVIAAASYFFVEKPFRAKGFITRRNSFIGAAVTVFSIVTGSVVAGHLTAKSRTQNPESAMIQDAEWTGEKHQGTVKGSGELAVEPLGLPGAPPQFMIWGDSHALVLTDMLDRAARSKGIGGIIAARGGVAPLRGLWRSDKSGKSARSELAWNEGVWKLIGEKRPRMLVLVACWSTYCGRAGVYDGEQTAKLLINSENQTPNAENSLMLMSAAVKRLQAECDALNIRLAVMSQVPEQPYPGISRVTYLSWKFPGLAYLPATLPSRSESDLRFTPQNRFFAEISGSGIKVINPMADFFDSDGRLKVIENGRAVYRDGGHLSMFGAEQKLAGYYRELFNQCFP